MTTVFKTAMVLKLGCQLGYQLMVALEELGEKSAGADKKDAVLSVIKDGVGDEIFDKFKGVFSLWVNLKAFLNFGSSGKDPEPVKE